MKINCEQRAISSWREIDHLINSHDLSSGNNNDNNDISLSLALLYGSWNTSLIGRTCSDTEENESMEGHRKTIMNWLSSIITKGPSCIASTLSLPNHNKNNNDGSSSSSFSTSTIPSTHEVISVKVDQDDETMDICIGDYASSLSLVNNANINNTNDTNNTNSTNTHNGDNDVIMANENGGDTVSGTSTDRKKDTNKDPRFRAPQNLPALSLVIQSKNSHGPQSIPIHFNHVELTKCLVDASNTKSNGSSSSSSSSTNNNTKLESLFQVIRGHISSSINTIREQPPPTISKQKKDTSHDANDKNTKSNHQTLVQQHPQLRIFIAGDKSQVGKSSICLGLIGTLLTKHKYHPSKLAYIKPATQCEESQLIAQYCDENNIDNQPIGPIVYYKGFTRAFLNGDTDDSMTLLQNAKRAVDTIAVGKEVVIIDGVGYPAVGSICGTDNVSVALACGYDADVHRGVGDGSSSSNSTVPPAVLIVGKRGVGDAIDSYNLNASYFKARNVNVMGAIFNRLPSDPNHFYSLESCKKAVSSYFENDKRLLKNDNKGEAVFGFIPEVEGLSSKTLEGAAQFIDIFSNHVDVSRIIERAIAMREAATTATTSSISTIRAAKRVANGQINNQQVEHERKKLKLSPSSSVSPNVKLTREQIESVAKAQGAAGG